MELDNIYNMDCLEGMKQIPDGSVDAVICDLPYGTTANKWDSVIPLDQLWAEYKRIVKKNAPIILFAQTPFDKILGCSNLEWMKYEWIWEKPKASGFLQAKQAPLKAHENILVFMEGGSHYNPQGLIYRPHYNTRHSKNGRCSNYGDSYGYSNYSEYDNYPRSVIEFAHDTDTFHPTQKPVDLLRYLVLTYTNEGDTVLDNCMGSGTTAIACIKEHRHFIGFELNKEYYDKACKRIKAEQAQLTLF